MPAPVRNSGGFSTVDTVKAGEAKAAVLTTDYLWLANTR